VGFVSAISSVCADAFSPSGRTRIELNVEASSSTCNRAVLQKQTGARELSAFSAAVPTVSKHWMHPWRRYIGIQPNERQVSGPLSLRATATARSMYSCRKAAAGDVVVNVTASDACTVKPQPTKRTSWKLVAN